MTDNRTTDAGANPPQSPPPSDRGGSGRGLRMLLFFSLALNLVFIGLFVGAALRPDARFQRQAEMRAAADAGLGPFGHALTREQRRAFGREIAQRSRDLEANRGQIREALGAMLQALRATPFDARAFRRGLEQTQQMLNARQRIGAEALMNRLQEMSDEERAAFADRLEESLRRLRPRR